MKTMRLIVLKVIKNKEGRKIMEEMTKLIEEVETTLAPFFKDIEKLR